MKVPNWIKSFSAYESVRAAYHRSAKKRSIRKTYEKNLLLWGKQFASLDRDAAESAAFGTCEEMICAFQMKETYLLEWLRNELREVLQRYENEPYSFPSKHESIPRIIWVYWWDGLENAPQIVQCCLSSIKQHAKGFEVRFVDRTNLEQYLAIPPFLMEKQENGAIGKAHFSDVIRMMLLGRYGGVWMDATLYCSKQIPSEVTVGPFYSCKKEWNESTPSHGRWSGWMFGGIPAFRFFSFMEDALTTYWRKHSSAIDYLLMDYLFSLAYEILPELQEAVDHLLPQNSMRDELMRRINEPYVPSFFENDTFLYKHSYRYGNPVETTRKGQRTFYSYILHENGS